MKKLTPIENAYHEVNWLKKSWKYLKAHRSDAVLNNIINVIMTKPCWVGYANDDITDIIRHDGLKKYHIISLHTALMEINRQIARCHILLDKQRLIKRKSMLINFKNTYHGNKTYWVMSTSNYHGKNYYYKKPDLRVLQQWFKDIENWILDGLFVK